MISTTLEDKPIRTHRAAWHHMTPMRIRPNPNLALSREARTEPATPPIPTVESTTPMTAAEVCARWAAMMTTNSAPAMASCSRAAAVATVRMTGWDHSHRTPTAISDRNFVRAFSRGC
jgi:hypothetical protein